MTRIAAAAFATVLLASASVRAEEWARFRGPNGTGVVQKQNIPATWSSANILFEVEIPGTGHGSPIVSKGKVFLQAASADAKERYLHCLDAKSGKILWSRQIPGEKGHTHAKSSHASSTPAADGEQVYAVFWDGAGLKLTAWDYEGNPKWKKELGRFVSDHGAGLSPMVVGDKVILNVDQGDGKDLKASKAELMAFDRKTGDVAWTKKREPERASYSTPFLLDKPDAGSDLIVCSTGGVTAYNPADGKEIWHFSWQFDKSRLRTVGSPIFHQGMIFAIAGDGGGSRNMVAIKATGSGDVSKTAVVWRKTKGTAYVPSPLATDGLVFWVADKENVAVCADAKTGAEIWSERLGSDSVSSSPVMVDGNIFVISEKGTVFVFAAKKEFEQLGKYDLKEGVYATPAVADGRMYIRGFNHLFCVGSK
jgi:outer membrane protein assembly factor BamB